jgi:prolyl oligopeptidase
MRKDLFATLLAATACATPTGVKRPIPSPAVAVPSASAAPGASAAPAPKPRYAYPPTPASDLVELTHGVEVRDPYRWLEDGASEDVKHWAKAENAFARAWLDRLPERDALRKRFRELYDVERVWPPLKRGERYFWSQKDVGREKEVLYVRTGKLGEKKVLLDPNTWSEDGSVSLGGYSVSYDGKLVAYQVKKNNSDEAVLEIVEVSSGKKRPDVIDGAKYTYAVAWNRDGSGFYYVKVPPLGPSVSVANRPGAASIRFHKLGTDPNTDPLVHGPTGDPKTFQAVDASRDGRFLIATVQHGWVSSDVYFQDLVKKRGEWQTLVAGTGDLYDVRAYGGKFYALTNRGAPRFKLYQIDPARASDTATWTEIVPERADTTIDHFTLVGRRLSLVTIRDVVERLEVRDLDGKLAYDVALPEPGSVSALIGNEDEDEAYFRSESFSKPAIVSEISVRSGKTTLVYETHVPVDASRYVSEQRFAISKDGTKVPYFLLRDRERPLDGSAPALLYGYGGFSVSLTPTFSTTAFPWLEHGGVFAIANLRGGAEYGEDWHRAGMRHEKQHVFDDFVAVAEALIAQKATRADRLVIRGDSNGGLLVGAAMTERPDLFKVVLCGVPLLDMLRYHLFGSGQTWIEEYGSPDDAADFKTLYAYSPYHHVEPGVAYPSTLLFSADSDDRVDPMHARKFAALLQARSTGGPVLLRIQEHAGHGGADKIQALVEERADAYAFALSEVAR